METLVKKTRETILTRKLIAPGDRVLAGVSGGADSVALLLALKELSPELGFSLCAAHLNHGIRGEAAKRDQAYVEALCREQGTKLYIKELDIPAMAKAQGKTLEQAARDSRYAFFTEAAEAMGAGLIAVAHHMEDQAESIMLHLVRGTGLLGLCGMRYRRDRIIRPLLNIHRGEIEEFLRGRGAAFCTDDTNFERDASRNRLRLDVIPYIEENLNSGFVEGLCSMSQLLRRDEEYLSEEAERALDGAKTQRGYDRARLDELPLPIKTRALRIAMARAGAAADIDRVHVEQVMRLLSARTGAETHIPHLRAWVSYESICFGARREKASFEAAFCPEGKTELPSGFYFAETVEGDIIKQNAVGYMDADRLPAGLVVRPRENGDRFFPIGSSGSKKLKDFFIDRKAPREDRQVPILFSGSEALFIPGWGISDRVKVTDATRRILRVEYFCEK